jgi:hypothetical protein
MRFAMLPNLSSALAPWIQSVVLKTITQTVVNFKPVNNTVSTTISAVVQPAKLKDLTVENVDYSLAYLQIHSLTPVKIGDVITYKTVDHKIVQLGHYDDYGFYEAIAEEVR